MSEHDRIVFDLKGYIVKPAVLSQTEVEEIKEFVLRQKNDPESLPFHQRSLPGGAFAPLIDHPCGHGRVVERHRSRSRQNSLRRYLP